MTFRFKRDFLLYRKNGLRERLSYTEYMGLRQLVSGIKSAGGDARGVVTSKCIEERVRIVFLCVIGVDYNAICACFFFSG